MVPNDTEGLLLKIRLLEAGFSKEQIEREEVVLVIEEGLKVLSIQNQVIDGSLKKPTFSIRRRTGVSLVEAAMAVQKGMSLLARLDGQTDKPYDSLLKSRVTPQVILSLVDAQDEFQNAVDNFSVASAQMSANALAEDWVHVAWGKFWVRVLVSWAEGYGQSGAKPWLDFVEEVYNIGDESPRGRSWLRRKFDEVYERCIQQPELERIFIGEKGWLPPKPVRGRKSINAYLQKKDNKVEQWSCKGSTPTGDCSFRITPSAALNDGLNFPESASEHDRRRCPESLYCGGLCVPQFEKVK